MLTLSRVGGSESILPWKGVVGGGGGGNLNVLGEKLEVGVFGGNPPPNGLNPLLSEHWSPSYSDN